MITGTLAHRRVATDQERYAMLFFGRKKRLIDYASCAG
jgi:hypothetical protein